MSPKILIVEDEDDFRDGMVELLKLENFDANGVGSIEEYLEWTKQNQYDILILDRNLPDGDGLDILKKYHQQSEAISIVLSCMGQPQDRILGMSVDADYYLVKPFPSDELLAILHRIKRRQSTAQSPESEVWQLNVVKWALKTPNRLEIALTKNEFALLNCFINQSGQVITRDAVVNGLGFNPTTYDNRRLEVMLRRLRKKIEDAGVVKFPLQTVYGVGLVFNGVMKASN
jgi:DNA-binding response OmpR family regulator